MIFIDNENTFDPRVNLAMEEYILRNLTDLREILLFYINEPSIIVGRHQNAMEEINRDYVEKHNIHVVRRLSGGGTVYHDHGNLNYSFITRGNREELMNFKKFTAPVVHALQEMGVNAELSGRNDILVDGRKISGNAVYGSSQGMICHGTLLLDTDLGRLSEALNVKPGKITSKGIQSVRSRVANISEFLKSPLTVEEFRHRILESIFADQPEIRQYHLTPEDWEKICHLSAERYNTWDWNYGQSPAYNIQKINRFPFGEIDARIEVVDGQIKSINFYGDFFCEEEPTALAELLIGTRYEKAALLERLVDMDLTKYFGGLSVEEFVDFLY
jgi:lipoate-protein ligase A